MDLPNLFSSGVKTKTEELVLFLVITDAKLQASLLELSREGVQILSKSKVFDFEGLDKCVKQTDLALQQLDKRSDKVSETVFAVNSSWVKNGEVIDEKKPFIKKLTDDLNLNPLGFIDIGESIAQQKVNENSLYSGIIVLLTKSDVVFTLIYQGKIRKSEVVGVSSDFKGDFSEGVARLQKVVEKQGNYLPAKLILASFEMDKTELHDYQQKIYDQNWNENKLFLQAPTVEILSHEELFEYLAREGGKNAASHKGLTEFAMAATMKSAPLGDVGSLDSSEFGFTDPLKEDRAGETALEEPPTSFGIPIKSETYETAVDDEADNVRNVGKDFMESKHEDIVLDKKQKTDWGHKKHTKWFAILGFGLGIIFLVIGLVFGSSFLTRTEAEITLNKKLVSKDIEITLDTKASKTDVDKLIIAANTVTKKSSDTNTIQTTGIKIVGENAKGKVAIYNKTDAVKTFDQGTQLKFGDLIYSLDEQIIVASASSKPGGTDYGKQEAMVTAAQIGAESNISKDSELAVAAYGTDTYNAFVINDDLAGGSSREVRVVAQKDLDELQGDLREELVKKINDEFADESGNGTYILPSKSIVDETAKFDREVDDEAEAVTLDLEIEIEAVTYSGGDLKPVAQEILSKDLPDNYELEDEDPQILSSPSQTDLDKLQAKAVVSIDANISSYAIPKLSESDIKNEIAGKPFAQAVGDLTAKEEISKATFKTVPGILSAFVKKVSSSVDRISIKFVK